MAKRRYAWLQYDDMEGWWFGPLPDSGSGAKAVSDFFDRHIPADVRRPVIRTIEELEDGEERAAADKGPPEHT